MSQAVNAILIGPCKSRLPIDGSLTNAFEYFAYAHDHNKNILLIIDCDDNSLIEVKKFLQQKYKINDEKIFYNIINYKNKIKKINNLILFEMISIDNFKKYNYLIYKKLYALSGSKYHTNQKVDIYFYEYDHLNPCAIAENKKREYISKIYFEILKKPAIHMKKTFINTRLKIPKKNNRITREDLNLNPKLFEKFNKMIYIQTPEFFDVKPRLFQECIYFNIPFKFIPHKDCFDGANYRAYDFDLDKRKMSTRDEIIKLLINF